ncbi:type II toxin-antitoxin system VapC family toxin [Meiothermus sp.]|jgi:predicted nucleic acid-binding protein|uniref:type II toxin-antitoxin system VapC family toxin n=1 Tax=Meiothermus sp. TaxID=1955249 RepID=UPI0021DBB075|nr:type II toxin-antitoxin system VapC family toxin [Meiothermus sp.]GIW26183.1 MAG: ribonuclease VapC [Meiothermus sp.]
MSAYFDTSALVKRYDPNEAGASQVMAFLDSGSTVFTSTLTALEVVSAFRIKERSGVLTTRTLQLALTAFEAHALVAYKQVAPQPSTYLEGKRLLLSYKLRAYDALHLATALTIVRVAGIQPGQLEFWTADQEQAAAARVEGLAVMLV